LSHDTVISALNALSKIELISFAPGDHVKHLVGESDRAAIILNASMLEHTTTHMLQKAMPGLNSDETSRMFGINGPLGAFSAKIAVAHGLKIIDRAMMKRMDVIRAMRNAAAHYVGPLNFDTEQIRNAVSQIASPPNRPELAELTALGLRIYLTHAIAIMASVIVGTAPTYSDESSMEFIRELKARQLAASLDKSAE